MIHVHRLGSALLAVAFGLGLGACGRAEVSADTPPPSSLGAPATATGAGAATPALPVALQDTGVEPFEAADFTAVHGPARTDGTGTPIFGALSVATAAPNVSSEIAAFLGRWEGFGYGPPIRRDWKFVLTVTEITERDGTAYLWAGTNLQFPVKVERVHFRVDGSAAETAIEWEQSVGGVYSIVRIRHAAGTEALEGETTSADPAGRLGPVLLRKDSTDAVVFADYGQHLADLGITWHEHTDRALRESGTGSLVYLPPGYHAAPERDWPLILFFHGAGDRGDNGLVLAQNSPFRFVTAGERLDAIIVAPLLDAGRPAFPGEYTETVLDDALASWRVDRERITVTGLSMGGEATYRLARHRPGAIAGIAVLCGFEVGTFPAAAGWGYQPIDEPPSALAGMPVRIIHGSDDLNIPVSAARAAAAALVDGGADVELIVLDHHDHDVWTDTYEDPALFDWLAGQRQAREGPPTAAATRPPAGPRSPGSGRDQGRS